MSRVEIVLATMNQAGNQIINEMNIQTPIVIANQCDNNEISFTETNGNAIKKIDTTTRGVGINRNIGITYASENILLFADDDVVYYDGYENMVIEAFSRNKYADVIIFNYEVERNGLTDKAYRIDKEKKVGYRNSFRYGMCSIAVKRKSIEKCRIKFSTLFGGGSKYGSGEDSLFILDCLRNKLNIYVSDCVIEKNLCKPSTWFNGYNEKYFFDKGAWIAAAFPQSKYFLILYFCWRFSKLSSLPVKKQFELMKAGFNGYSNLKSYIDYCEEVSCD